LFGGGFGFFLIRMALWFLAEHNADGVSLPVLNQSNFVVRL
jgi:hypothetical protein